MKKYVYLFAKVPITLAELVAPKPLPDVCRAAADNSNPDTEVKTSSGHFFYWNTAANSKMGCFLAIEARESTVSTMNSKL